MERKILVYFALCTAVLAAIGHSIGWVKLYSTDGIGAVSIVTSICICLICLSHLLPKQCKPYLLMPTVTIGILRLWAYLSGCDQAFVRTSCYDPSRVTPVTAVLITTAALSLLWKRGCTTLNLFVIFLSIIALGNHFGPVLTFFFSGTSINTSLAMLALSTANLITCPDVAEDLGMEISLSSPSPSPLPAILPVDEGKTHPDRL